MLDEYYIVGLFPRFEYCLLQSDAVVSKDAYLDSQVASCSKPVDCSTQVATLEKGLTSVLVHEVGWTVLFQMSFE
jgi:hypothetical protein